MATVTDPRGVHWRVSRKWWEFEPRIPDAGTGQDKLAGFVTDVLVQLLLFPLAFIVHSLGLPWVVVIERDDADDPERVVYYKDDAGEVERMMFYQVGKEKVRGWFRSGRRIQEIAELAAAGTLEQSLGKPPFTLPDGG
jgi:hypothetical protein